MHLDSRTRFNEFLIIINYLHGVNILELFCTFRIRLPNAFVSKSHKTQENTWFPSSSTFSGPNVLKKLSGKCRTAGNSSIFLHFVRFAHEGIKETVRKMQNCWKTKYFLAFCEICSRTYSMNRPKCAEELQNDDPV